MKHLVTLSLTFAFLHCILAGCANAQRQRTLNLSTDKAVLERLGVLKEKEFSKDKVCIGRLKESKQVIVIGFFRNDDSCRLDGAFVYSVYIEDSPDFSPLALNALGWKKANQKGREALAKLWVAKGLLAFSAVLYVEGDDFVPGRGRTYRGGRKPNFPPFHPPQVVSRRNGEVVVTLWTSSLRREKRVGHHKYTFTKDGSLRED